MRPSPEMGAKCPRGTSMDSERSDYELKPAAQLGKDDSMLKGVLHNGSIRVQVERVHQPVFVEGHRTCGEIEYSSNLFHRFAFGEQLQNFDLPLGQRDLFVRADSRHGIRKELSGLRKLVREIYISLQDAT